VTCFVQRGVAGFGIAVFVRFTGAVERDITVLIGDVLAVLHAARCRLMMQLSADGLWGARTGFGTRRGGIYLLLKRHDLRGARSAMGGADAAEHYSARCANDAEQVFLSAHVIDGVSAHVGLPECRGIQTSNVRVPTRFRESQERGGREIYLPVIIGLRDVPEAGRSDLKSESRPSTSRRFGTMIIPN
jgi:hypothetical protein